jgi:hypothetical protein
MSNLSSDPIIFNKINKWVFQIPEVGTIVVTIDNHMAVIQVQIGKNTIEDVLLDGGFGVNIIT